MNRLLRCTAADDEGTLEGIGKRWEYPEAEPKKVNKMKRNGTASSLALIVPRNT